MRHPFDRKPAARAFDGAALLASVRQQWKRVPPASPGNASANDVEPGLAAACAYANVKYGEGRALPWSTLGEAVAAASLTSNREAGEATAPLVDLWIAELGPIAALEALVAERGVHREKIAVLPQEPDSSYIGRGIPGKWRVLRTYLCGAPPGDYDAALEHARGLRSSGSLPLRCALSYLFPQETAWAAEDARTALGPPLNVGSFVTLLLTSLVDVELAVELIRAASRGSFAGLGATDLERALVDGRLTTGMRRLDGRRDEIVDALDDVRRLRVGPLAELHAIAPRAVTRALVGRLGDANADADARAFLAAHPRDAMEALADALAKGRRRALLTPVLSVLVAMHRPIAIDLARSAPAPAARALILAGGTDELLSRAGARKLAADFARVRVPALAQWLEGPRSRAELTSVVRSAAADATRVPLLAGLARASAPDSPAFAMCLVDALAEAKTAACALALANVATKLSPAGLDARARERLHSVMGLTDEDIADLAVPRRRLTAHQRAAQVRRLELAMVEGRRWTAARFAETILGHPFLARLARGLVWGVFGEDDVLLEAALIDERGTLRGARGEELDPSGKKLGVAHPVELSEEQRAWARAEGLGASLFEQLPRIGVASREVVVHRPHRAALATLVAAGWSRYDPSADEGTVDYHRIVRGCEAAITVMSGAIVLDEWISDEVGSKRDRAVALFEARYDVARACGDG